MALLGEGTYNPLLGQGGVQGAAGNFAGMQPGSFALTPIPPGMAHTADSINMQPAFFDKSAGLAAGSLGYPTTISNAKGSGYGLPSKLGQLTAPPVPDMGMLAHGSHTTESFVNGVPRYWPGSHDPIQHNELRDPAGRPIPGTAPKDSDIPLSLGPATGNPLAGLADIPGSSVGNMAGLSDTKSKQSAAKKEAYIKALEGEFDPIKWFNARKIKA